MDGYADSKPYRNAHSEMPVIPEYADHNNAYRLSSAFGYVEPKDSGRDFELQAAGHRKLQM